MKAKENRLSDGIISECRITCQKKQEYGFGQKTGWRTARKGKNPILHDKNQLPNRFFKIVLLVNLLTSVIVNQHEKRLYRDM